MSDRAHRPVTRRRFLGAALQATAGGVVLSMAAPSLVGAASAASPEGVNRLGLPPRLLAPDDLVGWFEHVYSQVRAERCSPPSAARIYGHVMLAAYEVVAAGSPHQRSLSGRLNGLAPITAPVGVHWPLAVNEAVAVTAAAVFRDRSQNARQAIDGYAADQRSRLSSGLAPAVVNRSVSEGARVGRAVAQRADGDGYLGILGRSYTPPEGPDKWVRTPPNFGSALEPFWGEVRSFTLTTNDECKPIPPVPYSTEPGSSFWNQATTVYETSKIVTDEQRMLALFWRDNPDGTTGLPSGHWVRIAALAATEMGLMLDRTAEAMAVAAIAAADGFTSCWTEKYQTNLLRPVTYVQRHINPAWNTFVNSPAFPEYTSGHSVGSGAAAGALTRLLGQVAFTDTTGRQNGYPDRRYSSFREAAEEAAQSRLWGGIHYPMGIEQGLVQGDHVARLVMERATTR